ncbi:MAG: lantibiotic biosynthesis protein [Solirubrobacteraceae bacterium]|nr:lantibiotic biosynthesis protein [Solirubrobacteraceae bacterium]
MTPKTITAKGAAGPRARRRRRESLYRPAEWALVRAPLLPADTPGAPADPRVRAAVAVASSDLAAALARADGREGTRAHGKLLRYLIRMSTRPTPYGLFAGVGLAGWGDETDLEIGARPPRTRTRPDMEWLLDLVAALERDPEVRPGLRLLASSTVVFRAGRAFATGGAGSSPSVRATGAMRRALELARTPVSRAALAEGLAGAREATPEKVEKLIDELERQGFLVSDLRPPLTGGDPVAHVLDRLAGIPAAAATSAGLASLAEALAAWDVLPLEERGEQWPALLDRVRAVHATAKPGSLLQTDMALPLAGSRIHAAVGAEAARAAELLLRLSPYPRGMPQLDAYRRAFEARYGPDREVPLLELLDPELGLGPPAAGHGVGAPQHAERQQLLRDLALDAHRKWRLVVELDDDLLRRLETSTPDPSGSPPSIDLSLFVAAPSPEAIDAGRFQVIVGPNLGASSAGRNLGRFADLLGSPARAALAEVADAEAELRPGCIVAEVVYRPQRARSANVAIRPAVRAHEIVFGTLPGVAPEQVVPAGELVVGLHGGIFRVRWPARDAEVVGVQGHMLNPLQAPPAARFLLDIANHGRCQLSSFNWGAVAGFPFLPRVQCGRVVLAPAQWRIEPGAFDLAGWRERWSVPRRVYLAVGDNRLLLDLDDSAQAEILHDELRTLPAGRQALVQEALPGPEDAWLPGPDGGHITELVVPLTLRAPSTPTATEPAPRPATVVPAHVRTRPPGSDWLYLKLYGPRSFQDELIAGPLRDFTRYATSAGLADGWFFLRYSDPQPHLRVRFHGEPEALLGPLMQGVCEWAGELIAGGSCSSFAFDTYEREVERYGGEEGIRTAEAVFAADSPAVAEIVRLGRQGELPFDVTTVAALSIDDLLDALGLDADERLALYRDAAPLSRKDGDDYRRRRRDLRALLGRPHADSPLAAALAARRAALIPAGAQLGSLDRTRAQLCRSYIHLHANRLGPSVPEQRVLQLLRRTREGLSRAPV